MAVVFTFVLCQALHSDRKGKFPVFLRKNSIAYESMGRRLALLLPLYLLILYPQSTSIVLLLISLLTAKLLTFYPLVTCPLKSRQIAVFAEDRTRTRTVFTYVFLLLRLPSSSLKHTPYVPD